MPTARRSNHVMATGRNQLHRRPLAAGYAIGALLMTASVTSCDDRSKSGDGSSHANLTQAQAIDAARAYLFGQSRPSTTVEKVCRRKPKQKRTRCSQFDVDADPNK